jgi:arabinofuranan 3-O-arabinosyltransferase
VSAAARADGGSRVRVEDASGPFYLTIGQNWDDGWRASIGGHDLGPPLLLDGYSAGWLIDRAGSYEVVVRYGPQSRYVLAVGLTALSVAAAVATIVIGLVRRRRRALGRRRGTALATASR